MLMKFTRRLFLVRWPLNWLLFITLYPFGAVADKGRMHDWVAEALLSSEAALYDANFSKALHALLPNSNQQVINETQRIALLIQSIRVQSFKCRLYRCSFDNDLHLQTLLSHRLYIESTDDAQIRAKYHTMLSSLSHSTDVNQSQESETKAMKLYQQLDNQAELAQLIASKLSRELSDHMANQRKAQAIAMIPQFEQSIQHSGLHNRYAQSYNTRHLANIYRIYELDLSQSLQLYEQSLEVRQAIGFKPFIPASHYSIGQVHQAMGNAKQALAAFQASANRASEVSFIRFMIDANLKIASLYESQGNHTLSQQHFLLAGIHQWIQKWVEFKRRYKDFWPVFIMP